MTIWLLRHGETEYNTQRRYLGRTDLPLSSKGREELTAADFSPETVYVSPLQRTAQTAKLLFPDARQTVIPDFREMDFGVFEGRTAAELSDDPDYCRWIESFCTGPVPKGESRECFSRRTCEAFSLLVSQRLAEGAEQTVIVAHGGTQMAVMERYAQPRRDYYGWLGPNGGGYLLDASRWFEEQTLTLLQTVQYTKGRQL